MSGGESAQMGGTVKGRITAIGTAWPHPADDLGRTWTIEHWMFDNSDGDFPGFDATTGLACGWTAVELALIADIARLSSYTDALLLADSYRGSQSGRPE